MLEKHEHPQWETEADRIEEAKIIAWFSTKYKMSWIHTPTEWTYDALFYSATKVLVAEIRSRQYDLEFFKREAPAIHTHKVEAMLKIGVPAFFIQKCLDGIILLDLIAAKPEMVKMWGFQKRGGPEHQTQELHNFYNLEDFKLIHKGAIE